MSSTRILVNKMNKMSEEEEKAAFDLPTTTTTTTTTTNKQPVAAPANGGDDDDESACTDRVTCLRYEFREYETMMQLIGSLPENVKDMRDRERTFSQFLFICDSYQEQPHLIDPFITPICDKLISLVKVSIQAYDNGNNKEEADEVIKEAFKYMHCLSKMRGYKKIVQHLPHEVADFEPVLALLARQDIADSDTWHTRYMLLLWLSIVCMIPFDLQRFDDNTDVEQQKDGQSTILNRFLRICTPYLFATDKCQDASAFLLAKFMSRIDVKVESMPRFYRQLLDWIDELAAKRENVKLLGVLKCLANMFKYSKREDLLPYTSSTLECLVRNDFLVSNSQISLVRKHHVKIIQRVGTTFFKLKVAKWRYQRGSRVLMTNLASTTTNATEQQKSENSAQDGNSHEEVDEMIPNEIEEIIEQLLFGLKDKDTIVRWSSAKGIGRIANRLPKDMAEDVLTSIVDLFTFVEEDSAWHGACLAIAELGRRGLLLPQQLSVVVPIVAKALIYDKKIGNYSLGRNVRDAACYVCWSLARAFEPHIIKPYVNEIASALLIVTVFDREVNCRRAASAAFQENVGRQGQFPHGIDILTKCDYYAVGQLTNCYLHLSVFIASFDEYKEALIAHLLEHKFNHWDKSIRELAARALHLLTACAPDYMARMVLPSLLKHALTANDLNTRHGALLCIGELVHALCLCAQDDDDDDASSSSQHRLGVYFNAETMAQLRLVIARLFDDKHFRGSGAELTRVAVCFLVKKLAISNLFHQRTNDTDMTLDEAFFAKCELFLATCFEYNKEHVQVAAADALPHYCQLNMVSRHLSDAAAAASTASIEESTLVRDYLHRMCAASKESARSGYALAIGALPRYLLAVGGNYARCVRTLMATSQWIEGPMPSQAAFDDDRAIVVVAKKNSDPAGWVEARKDSIRSLASLLALVQTDDDLDSLALSDVLVERLLECLFEGVRDYSMTAMGDQGSRVREAAVECLSKLVVLCGKHERTRHFLLEPQRALLARLVANVAQQCVERIDRQRGVSGRVFASLVYNEHVWNEASEKEPWLAKVRAVFGSREHCESEIEWAVAHVTLPLFAKLLDVAELQEPLLAGFVYSIGSLTESLVKSAIGSFVRQLGWLREHAVAQMHTLVDERLLALCARELSNERMSMSLVKTVDLCVQNGFLGAASAARFVPLFADNVRTSKDIGKLIAYVDLFCDMLQYEAESDEIKQRCMSHLMIMLCHGYPIIRKTVASKLFEALFQYAHFFDSAEDNDECVQLLTETVWDQPLDTVRPVRNRICELTKTKKPVTKAATLLSQAK